MSRDNEVKVPLCKKRVNLLGGKPRGKIDRSADAFEAKRASFSKKIG